NPPSGTHDVSFYCDDIEKTVAELRARGVEFVDDITDQGYGLTIHFVMPGNVRVELYQAHYEKPADTYREPVERFLHDYARAQVRRGRAALAASCGLAALIGSDEGALDVSARFQLEEFFGRGTTQYTAQGVVDSEPEVRKLEPLST